jgi:hypothetical protein
MKLNEELRLRTAGRYPRPGNAADSLPLVLGDFMTEDVAPSDAEDPNAVPLGGSTPAVLINRDEGWWLVNDAPSDPTVPRLYMNGRLQEESTYVYNPAAIVTDVDGQSHTVALILLNPSIVGLVLENEFSVDMRGAVDAQGRLISNPIDAIEYAFTTKGHWKDTDFDPVSISRAREEANALGYTIHWALTDHRTYKQHLTDILYHYHGNHTLNRASQLVITLDHDRHVPPELVLAHLDARVDVAGTDPEGAVVWDLDKRNLANVLDCAYRYSWVRNDYGETAERRSTASVTYYGEQRRAIRLPGIRSEHHLNQWASLFLNRYSLLPAIVRFPLRSLAYMGLLPTTYCTLSWAWGPNPFGQGWTQRILKVLNVSVVYDRHEIELECFDTGLLFRQPTYLAMQDQSGGLHYLRATTGQTWQLLDYVPWGDPLWPSPVRWIARQSQDAVTWYVYPTPDQRLRVSTVQPAVGTGISAFLAFLDRHSRAWGLEVTNTGRLRQTDILNIAAD